MADGIYLDHAATTPLDREVLEKMMPYFTEMFGNADSPHKTGRRAMLAVDRARDSVAGALHAKPNEIYFTSGGTEADNWAIFGGARAAKQRGRARVLVSAIEHHAVLAAADKLREEGFDVVEIPVDRGGRVEMNALESLLDGNTGLVAVMAANNETGVLQPVGEIAALAKARGALFFSDCVQLAPYAAIDVRDFGTDMLSLSSHKFYGPKGCGVLYIRGGVKTQGLIVGGEQERGLRGGTTNVPSVVGLAAAYEKNLATVSQTNDKLRRLRERFLEEFLPVGGVEINGEGERLPSVLNLRIRGVDNADFVYRMDLSGVCVAAGSACASASIKPSHVLTAMGRTEEEAKECVRVSFGKENTEEEVVLAAAIARETVTRLREKNEKL